MGVDLLAKRPYENKVASPDIMPPIGGGVGWESRLSSAVSIGIAFGKTYFQTGGLKI